MVNTLSPERIVSGVLETTVVMGSSGGFVLQSDPSREFDIPGDSAIIRDMGQPFALAGFEEERLPFVIGEGDISNAPADTNINSLPIKFPGTGYRVPLELLGIKDVLETCVSCEERVNEDVDEVYAFLSLQTTPTVVGTPQRATTIHCDGIQGQRIQPKTAIEHGYFVVDRDPPTFFPDPIDMSDIDVNVHLMEEVFHQRVNRERFVSFRVGQIAMIDGYCVHEPVPASKFGSRGFMRVLYSPRPYDRIGNSVNELFQDEYQQERWVFQPRPLPGGLIAPPALRI